jgi:hypothetical protein
MLAARRATAAAPAKAASKAAVRVRSVVVRAAAPQQQPQLMQKAKAVGKALLAQAILAAPAFADEGKLFDFNATLPVVRSRCQSPRFCDARGNRGVCERERR